MFYFTLSSQKIGYMIWKVKGANAELTHVSSVILKLTLNLHFMKISL